MLVSTRGRYALRVMTDLAQARSGDWISLRSIAERQQISEKYMEIIISALARAKLVEGQRGKGGGYRLTRHCEDYTLADILIAAEGSIAPVDCLKCVPNECPRAAACKTLPVWEGLDMIITEYLRNVSLSDIARPV